MTPGVACILPNTATDAKTFHPNSCVTIPTENSVKDGGDSGGRKRDIFLFQMKVKWSWWYQDRRRTADGTVELSDSEERFRTRTWAAARLSSSSWIHSFSLNAGGERDKKDGVARSLSEDFSNRRRFYTHMTLSNRCAVPWGESDQ